MGRASRRKAELRALRDLEQRSAIPDRERFPPAAVLSSQAIPERAAVRLVFEDDFNPPRLFRFFKEEAHADSFSSGSIWISTLSQCRMYENPSRGDPEEGMLDYYSGTVIGNGADSDVQLVA